MSILVIPTCPSDCSDLPAVDFNECAPEYHYGEIEHIYIAAADAASFTNVELLGEWTTRVTEAGVGADDIRDLTVIGELAEPEQTEIVTSGDRTAVGFKSFTLSFEVDETNDINYAFLMSLECNLKFKVWFETADGVLYGGNAGIEGTVRMNHVIPRTRQELTKFMGTVKWKSQFSPLRSLSPMA